MITKRKNHSYQLRSRTGSQRTELQVAQLSETLEFIQVDGGMLPSGLGQTAKETKVMTAMSRSP